MPSSVRHISPLGDVLSGFAGRIRVGCCLETGTLERLGLAGGVGGGPGSGLGEVVVLGVDVENPLQNLVVVGLAVGAVLEGGLDHIQDVFVAAVEGLVCGTLIVLLQGL